MRRHFSRLASDALVYGLGGAAGRFLNVILIPVLARLLSPEEFGLIDLVVSAAAVASYVLGLGLSQASSRLYFDIEEPSRRSRLLGTWLLFQATTSFGVCLLLVPLASPIADLLLRDPTLTPYIQVALLYVPTTLLVGLFQTVLRLRFAPWRYSLLSLTQIALNVVIILFLVVALKMGVLGVLAGYLAANAITALLGLGLTWRNFSLAFSFGGLRQMLRFGLPFVPSNVVGWVMQWSNRYFLVYLATTQAVGFYAVGSRLGGLIWLPITAFQLAWGPLAFSIEREPDAPRTYARVLNYYVLGTSALAVMLSVFARPALLILASPAFYPGHTVAGLVAFALAVNGANQVVSMGLLLAKKTTPIAWITAASAALAVVLNLWLIPLLGAEGAAVAFLASQVVRAGLLYVMSQRHYFIPYHLGYAFKAILLAVAAATLGMIAETGRFWSNLALEAAIALGYLSLIYPLGLIERRELTMAWGYVRLRYQWALAALRGGQTEESGSPG